MRTGSVLVKERSCLFPAPLEGLIGSEEDVNALRFCDQNGLTSALRRGGKLILLLASQQRWPSCRVL